MSVIFDISKITVLVVDDTSMMRAMHTKHLKSMGIDEKNISIAEDGEQALIAIKNRLTNKLNFDLVVCDWDMPRLTGIDFLKKFKAIAEMKDVKFLMVTARGEKKDLLKAIQGGVNGYIIKPFKMEDYAERVMSLIASGFVGK